jgi:hypothetical protein
MGQMVVVRFTPDVRSADSSGVQSTTRIGLGLAVAGAGLVVAAVHGAGAPASDAAAFAAPVASGSAVASGLSPASPSPVAVHVTAHPLVRVVPHKPAPRRSARPAPQAHPAPTVRRVAARPALSFTAALMRQVARIPTYHSGQARWVVSRAYDFWGTADWYHDVLYVSPDVPRSKLYDVAVHEWSHELSVLDYGGDVDSATSAMNAWFGGSGLTGAERAADCMAILQGATWTHYTTCTNAHWQAGARLLVSGKTL